MLRTIPSAGMTTSTTGGREMFGWRRRSEGFEWKEYVRTTVLVRRADRQRRLDDAQMAALAKVKDARDRGIEAGKAGIDEVRGWFWNLLYAFADAAWSSLKTGGRAIAKTVSAMLDRVRHAAGTLAMPALPGVPALKSAGQRLLTKTPSISLPRGIRADHFVSAGALALIVLIGGRALSPPPSGGEHVSTGRIAAAPTNPSVTVDELTGRASAAAGGLLRVAGTVVRLKGIEAPEARQSCSKSTGRHWPCGQAATDGLNRLVRGKTIACSLSGTDDDGHPLAACATGKIDIAGEMVRLGYVFAETGILRSFASEEDAAKIAKTGLWQGEAERPSEWRQRLWEEAKRTAPDGCPIKGLVKGAGRIYAMPWSNDYASGKVRTVKGERWFCSEQEARAAGFKLSERS